MYFEYFNTIYHEYNTILCSIILVQFRTKNPVNCTYNINNILNITGVKTTELHYTYNLHIVQFRSSIKKAR